VTFFIYLRAGRTIYEKRRQLHDFSQPEPDSEFGSVKTTEVFVTSEVMEPPRGAIGLGSMGRRDSGAGSSPRAPNAAYSVTISSSKHGNRQSQGDIGLPIQSNAAPIPRPPNAGRRRNYDLNNAAWSYTKCAILFFTAILITWIPSSANRVYSVVHAHKQSTALEYMSALVLPLQGFWNAIIYVVTSWKATKAFFSEMTCRRRSKVTELAGFRSDHFQSRPKTYDSESMTELASSRPNSNERQYR
jgi:hypothetical protein